MRDLFLIDPDVVYLNHGSYGACPRPVFERYQHWQRELEREAVDWFSNRLAPLLADARAALGAYVGAAADDLTFVENATAAVNLAARAVDLEPGDEVLSTDLEYGACDYTWQEVCARAGARYVRAEIPLPVGDVTDALFARRTDRTRVVYVSHITSGTGLLLPVEQIVARARGEGLTVIVDGAHAPGHVDLDLDALGADFYAGNCHKWLCSPKGAGFLHVRGEWQDRVGGAIVSWGYEEPATFISRTERQGTRDSAAYLSVPAAIEFVREHDEPERCIALAREARRALCELLGEEPIAPESMVMRMASFRVPDAERVARELWERERIEIPAWPSGLMRLSVAMYTNEQDVERLLTALGGSSAAARSRGNRRPRSSARVPSERN